MKIITEDFQSLKGTNKFEFNAGINLIIGSNGSGKSSLFYAIENCLQNPNGVDDCINFDSNSTRVTIENNDESITWIREKGSSTYINNKTGDVKFKASKLTSLDLANLGFYFDKKNKIMNIHNEWSVLFPFGESDTDMFRLFEDIFNISCSFDVLDNIKHDEQNIKSQIKKLLIDREQLQDKLNKLNNIASELNTIDIDNLILDIRNKIDLKQVLEQDYIKYTSNHSLSNIVLPKTFDTSELYDYYHKVNEINKDLQLYKENNIKKSIFVDPINIIIDFKSPDDILQDYTQYLNLKNSILNYESESKKLEDDKNIITIKKSNIKICPTCGQKIGG